MPKKLFIGGLAYSVTDDQLRDAFALAGTVVSATVLMDRVTGRSRGFGFVEMEGDSGAQAAIDMYNGKEIAGRKVIVNEARPMEARPPRREGGYRPQDGGGRGDY